MKPSVKSLVQGVAKAAGKTNQALKAQTAKGNAPDPHRARFEHPGLQNLKDGSVEIVKKVAKSAVHAVKSRDLDR